MHRGLSQAVCTREAHTTSNLATSSTAARQTVRTRFKNAVKMTGRIIEGVDTLMNRMGMGQEGARPECKQSLNTEAVPCY